MGNINNLSFLEIYENINELKSKDNKDFFNFDLLMTKNEFTTINGSFFGYSEQLEAFPIIQVLRCFTIEQLSNSTEKYNDNTNSI